MTDAVLPIFVVDTPSSPKSILPHQWQVTVGTLVENDRESLPSIDGLGAPGTSNLQRRLTSKLMSAEVKAVHAALPPPQQALFLSLNGPGAGAALAAIPSEPELVVQDPDKRTSR